MKTLDQLKTLLEAGQIGRREFMGRALAAGATVAMASTLASKALKAAMPKKGGRFRMGMGHGSTTDSLDPGTFENGYIQVIGYGLRGHLTEVSNTGKLIPDLAESWEATPDAKTWTFKVRQGVEFHNGKTLDATDVIASINHHRG